MFKLIKRLQLIDWLYFICAVFSIVLQVWLDIKVVDYTRNILLILQNGGTIEQILQQGVYMLSCALISLLGAIICGFLFALISARIARNLRREVYLKVHNLSMADIKKFSVPSLITRTTNDIGQVQMFIAMGMQMIIKAPLTAIWAITKMANKNWEWSTLTIGAVITIVVGVSIIMSLAIPKFKKIQTYIDDINNVTKEQLTGIRVVHAFNAETYQENKFEEKNNTLTKTQIFTQKTMGFMNPLMYLVMNLMSLGIYWIGAFLINGTDVGKDIMYADMGTFNGYASQVVSSFLTSIHNLLLLL